MLLSIILQHLPIFGTDRECGADYIGQCDSTTTGRDLGREVLRTLTLHHWFDIKNVTFSSWNLHLEWEVAPRAYLKHDSCYLQH